MLTQLSRAARARSAASALSRLARGSVPVRAFIAPTVSRRADFVQELYLKELKAYKIPPVKADDSKGQVQTFNEPKQPKSPEEADLASNLKEYENLAVEVEGQQPGAGPATYVSPMDEWLEEELKDDVGHDKH